jgi:predicted RND superfamily exporter protein
MAIDLDSSDGQNIYEEVAKRIEQDASFDAMRDLKSVLQAVPELRRLVVAAAVRALGARKVYLRNGIPEYESDCSAQMKAAAFIAAYCDGLPVQTSVNLNVNSAGKNSEAETLLESLTKSPALAMALEKKLQQASKRRERIVTEVTKAAAA